MTSNKVLADYAMVFDLLSKLTGIMTEAEVIENILDLFAMLCAPTSLVYVPFVGGEPGTIQTRPASLTISEAIKERLISFREDYAWTESGAGFLLRIRRNSETLGILEIDGIAFPEYRERYLNLALTVVQVLALAISNARNYERLERAREVLREERDRAQQYLDIAGVILVVLAPDQTVSLINKKGCEILGYEEQEIVDRNWFDHFLPESDRERVKAVFAQLMAGELESAEYFENPVLTGSGGERIIAWHNTVLTDEAGNITGTLSSGEDITERVRAEEALKEYSERLEEMVEQRTQELQEAQEQLVRRERLAMLGQLAGGVAHELRNPLGVIANAVYLLQMTLSSADSSDIDETTREALEMIAAEVRNSDKIITDLLNFSRIRPAERQPVALSELIAQVLARQSPPAGVAVTTSVPPDLPPLFVDPQQIEQVLTNLVINAYQAMPDGGRLVIRAWQDTGTERHGEGEWGREGACARISVSDTGVGIPAENLNKVFEPLFTTKPRGIGLGLAISQMLVEANGGCIEVESQEGKGSTFTVTLPSAEVDSER